MGQIFIQSKRRSLDTTRGGEWNFPTDGGAVGTINQGIFIPAFGIITRFRVHVITTVTSGGLGTISFGFTGSTQAYMVTTAIAQFTAGAVFIGIDLYDNPIQPTTTQGGSSEVLMTIGTSALTAGRFAWDISYTEFDF